MKHVLLILATVLVVSCQKSSQNNSSSNSTTSTSSTSNTLTHQDSMLVGDWIVDVYEYYSNGTLLQTTPHNDPANCHLHLMSSFPPGNLNWKDAVNGLGCSPVNGYWRVTSGQLDMGTVYTIDSLSTTKLIIQHGSISVGGGNATKYYLHK